MSPKFCAIGRSHNTLAQRGAFDDTPNVSTKFYSFNRTYYYLSKCQANRHTITGSTALSHNSDPNNYSDLRSFNISSHMDAINNPNIVSKCQSHCLSLN